MLNSILALCGDDHSWTLGMGGPLICLSLNSSPCISLVPLESGHFLHSFQSFFGSLTLCGKMLGKWEFRKPKGLRMMT